MELVKGLEDQLRLGVVPHFCDVWPSCVTRAAQHLGNTRQAARVQEHPNSGILRLFTRRNLPSTDSDARVLESPSHLHEHRLGVTGFQALRWPRVGLDNAGIGD